MAGWITAAVRTLGHRSRPEALEFVCLCGEGVPVQRTASAQEIRCPRCGERLFVLPADVYPPSPRAPVGRGDGERIRAARVPASPPKSAPRCRRIGRRLMGVAAAMLAAFRPRRRTRDRS